MQQNATAAGAPPRTMLGSLQRSPGPLAGFKGAASGWKGKGGEGQGGMRKAGEGSWNRAADWLRPALTMVTFNFIRMI